jgi:hypothetical protein
VGNRYYNISKNGPEYVAIGGNTDDQNKNKYNEPRKRGSRAEQVDF